MNFLPGDRTSAPRSNITSAPFRPPGTFPRCAGEGKCTCAPGTFPRCAGGRECTRHLGRRPPGAQGKGVHSPSRAPSPVAQGKGVHSPSRAPSPAVQGKGVHSPSRAPSPAVQGEAMRSPSGHLPPLPRGRQRKPAPHHSRQSLNQASSTSTAGNGEVPALTRSFSRSAASISLAIAACSLRYRRTLSLPWPMRSPL